MEKMLSTPQVLNAIHRDLPRAKEREDIPTKRVGSKAFNQHMSRISVLERHPLYPPTPEEIDQLKQATQASTSIRELISNTRACIVEPFYQMSTDYVGAHEKNAGRNPESRQAHDAFKEMHWQRYNVNRSHATEAIRRDYKGCSDEIMHIVALNQIVLGGIQNVTYNICASLCAIPKLYQETTNRVIRPRTWNHIGESSLTFVEQLATSEMSVFDHGIIDELREKNARPEKMSPKEDLFDWPGFDTKALRLNEKMELCLHENIIEPTRDALLKQIENEEIQIYDRVGCPGLAAFPIVHRRVMLAAKEGIFPYAEHVLSLPPE